MMRPGVTDSLTMTADETNAEWYRLTTEDIVERLSTDTQRGLDDAAVAARRSRFGANEIPAK